MSDNIDKLYEIYSVLAEAGDNVTDHEAKYTEILNAVKGSDVEKRLACQFIPKFLKPFPNLYTKALDAQLDLAEDDDVMVRKYAVKNLPLFCKVSKTFVPKIADVLTQTLLADDSCEFAAVQASLVATMEIDMKGTLQGILTQALTAEDNGIRKRAIMFLNTKLKVLPQDLLTKEIEEFFLETCKKVFAKVSGEDFINLLQTVSNLKIAKTIPVKNYIVDMIASQLPVNDEFKVSVDRFKSLLKLAYPYFSPFVCSNKFVSYICLKLFPSFDEIKSSESGETIVLDILKLLAEISVFLHKNEDISQSAEIVFNEFIKYAPLPPENVTESNSNIVEPNFSDIECLLFTLTRLLKHNDEIITADDQVAHLKDLKFRLQFLSRNVSEALKAYKDPHKSIFIMNKESKQKIMTARCLNNINALIKDFFRSPPSFIANVTLSWKSAVNKPGSPAVKRNFEASSSSDRFAKKEKRAGREIYVPPSGKYRSRITFSDADTK